MWAFSRSFKYSIFLQTSKRDAIKHGTAWLYIYISTQAYMVEWLWLLVLRQTPMMLEGPLKRLEFPRSRPDFDSSPERRHTCSALMSADDGRWCCSYSGYDCNNPPVPFVYGSFLRNIWQPGQDKTSLSCEPHMFFFHGLEHGPKVTGGSHVTMLCPWKLKGRKSLNESTNAACWVSGLAQLPFLKQ